MQKLLLIAALLIAVIVLPANISCKKHIVPAGDFERAINVGGITRTYIIHIPPSLDKVKPMPLIIALHGGGGQGKSMKLINGGGFNALARKNGFIVVYPNGINKQWNDSRAETGALAFKQATDDVGFISALIDQLITEMNVDSKRVYSTGISNGAMMSFRLACELPDKITAIAAVAGAMPVGLTKYNAPVPILMFSGTDDPLVHWQGGNIGFKLSKGRRGGTISVPDTVKFWTTANKCSPNPIVTNVPDVDPADGTSVKKEVYTSEITNCEVVLYTIQGGGHTWPGGKQYLPESIVGKTCKDINATEIIWEFFKKHQLK